MDVRNYFFIGVYVAAILLGITTATAQKKYELSYSEISLEQGLSQSTVTSIVQDSLGFMWIGTNDGLNRYDGLSIKVYNYQRNKPNSLSNGWVNSMVYDAKGQLWIGTNYGLNRYNFKTDSFEHVFSGYNPS